MSKWHRGAISPTVTGFEPLPEYRDPRPAHRSYKGPPIVHYGPPLPEHIRMARDEMADQERAAAMDRALENIRAQFGAGAVLVKR